MRQGTGYPYAPAPHGRIPPLSIGVEQPVVQQLSLAPRQEYPEGERYFMRSGGI